jgi:hypothetical protein
MLIDRPIHTADVTAYSGMVASSTYRALTTVQSDTFAAERHQTELHVVLP